MAERPRPGVYITNITTAVSKMVADIKELASAEIIPSVKHAGIGGGLFGGAGVFALFSLNCLLWAAVFAVSNFYHYVAGRDWFTALALAFVSCAVLLLILAGVLAVIGFKQLKRIKAPTATIAETKAGIAAITASVSAGAEKATSGVPVSAGR